MWCSNNNFSSLGLKFWSRLSTAEKKETNCCPELAGADNTDTEDIFIIYDLKNIFVSKLLAIYKSLSESSYFILSALSKIKLHKSGSFRGIFF